jgi:hypothetical protein
VRKKQPQGDFSGEVLHGEPLANVVADRRFVNAMPDDALRPRPTCVPVWLKSSVIVDCTRDCVVWIHTSVRVPEEETPRPRSGFVRDPFVYESSERGIRGSIDPLVRQFPIDESADPTGLTVELNAVAGRFECPSFIERPVRIQNEIVDTHSPVPVCGNGGGWKEI